MMANLQTFTAYRGPYDPYGSGDQSPWSATSDSFSSSSPASLMPPTPSYLVQPSIPVHGQGRPRSCSDPRAGGRDAPAPAATGVNPSLLLRLRDHQLRDHHASARVAPTTNAVASPSTSLPLVSNRPPGRPRASTGERLNAPLVYPNTSLYGYGSSLPVPIPASPSCSPNVEGRQRSRSVSRLSHRATPYSSLSSSPAFNPDETLPFHNLSVHSPSGSSVSHEMHPSPSGSVTLRLPQIKEKVTSPAVRAASFSRRTKDARLYCPFDGCGATFTRKHNLEGHIRAHTGERPFSCDYPGCSSEFARAGDLKRHKHIHDKAGRADMH
ncbi:hypothetical protein NEOLEDRAFT_611777 [Neolentinus lepideus HHB14362 ss-1]|uniref:C2H2-type domain-containing protein n=1 Tax=Neolentinus lepideus HHB14362 ss-1 TaxID=1314782 RepID=A0A165VF84_9AGAM|nr:hypothetical protein NEOLEDRAFT_611777 [Neolentinus lepideus HHB14362 ss-1]